VVEGRVNSSSSAKIAVEGELTLGIHELDKLLRESLTPGSLLVVTGHPGSGKTTLASTICYYNALRGRRCLYVSFIEHRDKLYANMRKLGLDLEKIEKEGLFVFMKLPLMVKAESVNHVLNAISEGVAKHNPGVVVVDSITPLLKAAEGELEARAILQNFFAELPRLTSGLVVLLAETLLNAVRVELGDLEFVADVVLVLKYRAENGLLARYLEIRKARGSAVNVAELPFSIVDGRGIVVYEPVVIEEIPATREGVIVLPCKALREAIGPIRRGEVVYVTYPPDARPVMIFPLILAIAVKNGAKVLFMSYKSSPEDIKLHTENKLVEMGLSGEAARRLIESRLVLKSLNATSVSPTQLNLLQLKIVMEHRPDLVVFHGVDIPTAITDHLSWRVNLLNKLLYLKKNGVTVVRMGSYDDNYNYNASLADIVVKLAVVEKSGRIEHKAYVWRRGATMPAILGEQALGECIVEVKDVLSKALLAEQRSQNIFAGSY
jgi:circadian clock protein KaiC